MNDNFSILKASGGSGFAQEVTSDKPWRPGEARLFWIKSRPVDPIYCQYEPKKALAALHLKLKSPLGNRFDGFVHKSPVLWGSVGGVWVDSIVHLRKALLPESPYTREKLAQGTSLNLKLIWRNMGLVQLPTGAPGWISMEELIFQSQDPMQAREPALVSSASWSASSMSYQISKLRYEVPAQLKDPTSKRNVISDITIRNQGERAARCTVSGIRLMHSAGGNVSGEASEALSMACGARIEPGTAATGQLRFVIPAGAEPLAVGQSRGGAGLVAISSQPAEE